MVVFPHGILQQEVCADDTDLLTNTLTNQVVRPTICDLWFAEQNSCGGTAVIWRITPHACLLCEHAAPLAVSPQLVLALLYCSGVLCALFVYLLPVETVFTLLNC
jgi:hypothetical protein